MTYLPLAHRAELLSSPFLFCCNMTGPVCAQERLSRKVQAAEILCIVVHDEYKLGKTIYLGIISA